MIQPLVLARHPALLTLIPWLSRGSRRTLPYWGGKPCIRGLRISVSTIVGLVASGVSRERILAAYPLLEGSDIDALQARAIRAWAG
jgi:uncharacterized protein (DUF433 family)